MDKRVVWGLLPVLLLLLSNAFSLSPAAAGPLDVDGGRSQGRVHVAINALRQVQGFVRQEFPNVEVLATPYPVALPKALLAKHVAPNRFGTAMGAWLVGNMAQSSLTQTGAFEIYANGEHIFSKLHAQRMPSSEELRKGLQGAGLTHITQLQASRGAAGQQQGALGL
ncbi:selenoprotein T, partial [Haematococcus lacustris]